MILALARSCELNELPNKMTVGSTSNNWYLTDKDCLNVTRFLTAPKFRGFTKQDLFIKNFIKKAWGQDIAALSNMAEAIANIVLSNPVSRDSLVPLLDEIVQRAMHKSVSPYRGPLENTKNLGHYGYYLEHLNIILGHYQLAADKKYIELGTKISRHLLEQSLAQENYHARLLPHVRMRWSADQAAIIYSLWLYDQANQTNLSQQISAPWLGYMQENQRDSATGLFVTEVMGAKNYSRQPRGCSSTYMIYYMSFFAPEVAEEQWALFKRHMKKDLLTASAFREYLKDFKAGWTPDSGPILAGMGVDACTFVTPITITVNIVANQHLLELNILRTPSNIDLNRLNSWEPRRRPKRPPKLLWFPPYQSD